MFVPTLTPSLTLLLLCITGVAISTKSRHGDFKECPCGVTTGMDSYEESEQTSEDVSGRIISGEEVEDLRKYPWIVGIIRKNANSESKKHHEWGTCGGALISPTFVLSAGHCFLEKNVTEGECKEKPEKCFAKPQDIQIGLLGEDLLHPAKIVSVKRIIRPHGYIPHKFIDDMALLELQHPVSCTPYSKPICVKPPEELFTLGKRMRVAGFGRVAATSDSTVLREGIVKLVHSNNCVNGHEELDPKNFVCAVANRDTTSCKGDSGTSGFIMHKRKFYSLAVVSFGQPMCKLNAPTAYTKTLAYFSFIQEHVKDLPRQPRG